MNIENARSGPLRTFGPLLLLALVGLLVYANSLHSPFIYDDRPTIEDPAIHGLWPPQRPLWARWNSAVEARPVASLTLAVNYALGGRDVIGYHLVNIAFHVLCALVLYGVVRRTLDGPPLRERFGAHAAALAFACALLWLVHPANTQVVDYITHRTESIMGVFYLLTLYCAIRARSSTRRLLWSAASVACCALGMASKEVMVTAPLMVALYDWAFRAEPYPRVLRQRIGLYAGLALTWIILAFLMSAARRGTKSAGYGLGVDTFRYLLNQCNVVLHYMKLAFWPEPLLIDYGIPQSPTVYDVAPQGAFLALLVMATVVLLLVRPMIGFLAAWFFVILAPTSSFMPILSEVGADRRMYLSLAGLVVLVVVGGFMLLRGPRLRVAGGLLVVIVAANFARMTWTRNNVYKSPVAVWRNEVRALPGNARAWNNLGNELVREGRSDEAIKQYREAIRVEPAYALPRINLANVLRDRGETERAVELYHAALQLLSEDSRWVSFARHNLGKALLAQGRTEHAIDQFRRVLAVEPNLADVHHDLGVALGRQGDLAGAIDQFRTALDIRPDDADTHFHLAIAYRMAERPEEAVEHLRLALDIDPAHAAAHQNLGGLLQLQGEYEQAIRHYRQALEVEPDSAAAHLNLGVALQSTGRPAEAIRHLGRAVELMPDTAQAHQALGAALLALGRAESALASFRRAAELDPEWSLPLSNMAWILATNADERLRNPAEAVEIAQRAASLAGGGDVTALDTLAAAYAATGAFDQAVATGEEALALALADPGGGTADRIRARVEMYRRGMAYREP